MSKFELRIEGLASLISSLDANAIEQDIDRITEAYTRKMANESTEKAPRDTGKLKNSIISSVQKEAPTHWAYGSDLPYATRQEYEHRTRKGFIRNTVAVNETPYRNKIAERLNEMGRS